MQKDNLENLIAKGRNLQLSEGEKNQMLASIRFAMREPVQAETRHFFSFKTIFASRYAFASLAVVLVASLSAAGISSAAENALPGDPLYPIKTEVNEKVLSAFAFTPERKAKVESDITVRRLKEAEALAAQGKLDEQSKQVIREDLATHSEKAIEVISKIQELPAAELNKGLDTSLHKHIEILNKLVEIKEEQQKKAVEQEKQQKEEKQKILENRKTKTFKAIQHLKERAEKYEKSNDREDSPEEDSSFRTRLDFNRDR